MATEFHSTKHFLTLKVAFILLLVAFGEQLVARPTTHISRPEKVWSIFHPFKARKVYRCAVRARFVTDSLEKAGVMSDKNGGQLDAFRHAYWMALLIQSGLSEKTARKVGENHERGNYLDWKRGQPEDSARADSMSSVMDLRNNESGIQIGKDFATGDKKVPLIDLVIAQIWDGKLSILKKDANGNYMDCSNQRIDIAAYKSRWYVPKCLVKSNEIVVAH